LYLSESEFGPSALHGPVASNRIEPAIAAPLAVEVEHIFATFDKTRLSAEGTTIKTVSVVIH
jgi:hypothetical protein